MARKEKRKASAVVDNSSKHKIKEALSLSKQNSNLHQRLRQQNLRMTSKSRISPKQDSKRAKSRKNVAT